MAPSLTGSSLILHLHETHPLFAACRHAAVRQRSCGCAEVEERQGTLVYQHELPNVLGTCIKGVLVEYGLGGYSPGHTHPKSAFIYATVLEGGILSQVNDGPMTTYEAGQSFSELPGDRHGVSANASKTKPAKLLAVFVVETTRRRTTRNVSLTDAGEMLHAHASLAPAFDVIASALECVNQFRDMPFGKVRLNVPNSIAPFVLGNVLGPLISAHPNLQLEVITTDRLVDIVEEGFDAGVRLGESLSEGMMAVKIKPRLRFAVVGFPEYFRSRSVRKTPRQLAEHICIVSKRSKVSLGNLSEKAKRSRSIQTDPSARRS